MIVTCSKCGCTITMSTSEGPLYKCPMCGYDFVKTEVSNSSVKENDTLYDGLTDVNYSQRYCYRWGW